MNEKGGKDYYARRAKPQTRIVFPSGFTAAMTQPRRAANKAAVSHQFSPTPERAGRFAFPAFRFDSDPYMNALPASDENTATAASTKTCDPAGKWPKGQDQPWSADARPERRVIDEGTPEKQPSAVGQIGNGSIIGACAISTRDQPCQGLSACWPKRSRSHCRSGDTSKL